MLFYRLPLAPKCRLRSGSYMPIADILKQFQQAPTSGLELDPAR
jgi:hypothetical protein